METLPNKLSQIGRASFCTKFALSLLRIMVLVSVAFAVTLPDEANSEYFFACSGGEIDKIKTLVEVDPSLVHATTRDGEHCLHLSALSGNVEVAKLLLEKGADPDIRSEWESGLRMHPLSWNTFYGRSEIIELLLKHGADVNADFDSAQGGNKLTVLDVVEQILMSSENDDDKKRFIETRNILVKNGAMRFASLEPEL
mmetsp:Transcript_55877/g.118832  ORF Transcript_55877/g.118832 Transcript_55877/m.118832 type:complete len:198 (-) Transcript_55877:456-1049(-)